MIERIVVLAVFLALLGWPVVLTYWLTPKLIRVGVRAEMELVRAAHEKAQIEAIEAAARRTRA